MGRQTLVKTDLKVIVWEGSDWIHLALSIWTSGEPL
jgi:hypothetical protein